MGYRRNIPQNSTYRSARNYSLSSPIAAPRKPSLPAREDPGTKPHFAKSAASLPIHPPLMMMPTKVAKSP
ncbi:hypothetical protein KFK09_004185 [Dendrobium nobile]|uniref:Uncharacterized protein n=1 Tax=Dendrobium nobile TaxID=94219 RepID=A0A8T3BZU8_DENNO|nr:hypothetical protein KFK09_004185 [Dendrobium nobile]